MSNQFLANSSSLHHRTTTNNYSCNNNNSNNVSIRTICKIVLCCSLCSSYNNSDSSNTAMAFSAIRHSVLLMPRPRTFVASSSSSSSSPAFLSQLFSTTTATTSSTTTTSTSSSSTSSSTNNNAINNNHNHSTNNNNNNNHHKDRSEILRSNSKLSLAPMMEYTDRHFRHVVRLLSDKTLLYTEMVAANAIAHERDAAISSSVMDDTGGNDDAGGGGGEEKSLLAGADNGNFDPTYLLRFLGQGANPEGPSVLQLGGSEPDQLFLAAKTVYEFNQLQTMQQQQQSQQSQQSQKPIYCNYTALNLNCGCPSPKVAGKGCFGAALMQDPHLVRRLTTSLHRGTERTMPITVKCRIGTDEGYKFTQKEYASSVSQEEEYAKLKQFIEIVASDGIVTDFQIHARIAVLNKNFSPADNRKVPPLRYHHVRRLAREFPELNISLNGGVETLSGVKRELEECEELEGVMVGRGWVSNPWAFAMADEVLYAKEEDGGVVGGSEQFLVRPKNRMEVLQAYGHHADYEEQQWDPVKIRRFLIKAVSHIFAGEQNAKRYRIALDDIAGLPKKMIKDPELFAQQPSLSELIMNAATTHLSEEVLYRTSKESYEKLLWEEEEAERKRTVVDTVVFGGSAKSNANTNDGDNDKKSVIQEWQQTRKEDELRNEEEGDIIADGK